MKFKFPKMVAGVVLVASTLAAPILTHAQGTKIVDMYIDKGLLQESCVNKMKGWESKRSIDQSADVEAVVKNNSKQRMLFLSKTKDGRYWSVADLEPGESRAFQVSSETNFTWAKFGARYDCVSGASFKAPRGTSTFK